MGKNCISDYDCVINNGVASAIMSGIEKNVERGVDTQKETEQILSMTPKEGFQKKIEIIYKAEDLSSIEKIEAINEAEDKYANDIKRNADLCLGLKWLKTGIILTCTASVVLMVFSPEGRKIASGIIKKIA